MKNTEQNSIVMQVVDVPIISINKLAELAGLKVSYIKKLIAEGEIPLKKRRGGGHQKIKVINLEAFKDQCLKEERAELNQLRQAIERRIIRG